MTLHIPAHEFAVGRHAAAAHPWPWRTGLLLFVLFAMANWSWSFNQRWYSTSSGQVEEMIGGISEGQLVRQVAFLLMTAYAIGALLVSGERGVKLKWIIAYPVVLFVAWAFLSFTWSIEPAMAGKRLIIFGAMVGMTAVVLRQFDIRQMAEIALIASSLTMAASILNELRLAAASFPGLGIWRFGGVMHPNHSGLNACVLMLACLYLRRFNRGRWIVVLFVLATAVLLATKSRTALSATLVACTVYLLLSSRTSRVAVVLLLAAWAAAALLWVSSIGDSVDISRALTLGREDLKDADVRKLTGRTDIWKFALMQAAKNPNRALIGYGYETFWTPENVRGVSEFVKFKIPEGHNLYLDWYLELGAVGVGLFALMMLVALWRWSSAARLLRSPAAALAAAVLCGTAVHGFAESSLGDASLPTMFVYAALGGAAILRPDEEVGV
ncbi:MAG TPA: O-antigen ligase family protein [Tepidisphaeraceae bacterium]|jgi:O-antigen ligase